MRSTSRANGESRSAHVSAVSLSAMAALLLALSKLCDCAEVLVPNGCYGETRELLDSFECRIRTLPPEAQTIASETFDLPEPFGPTTTATPVSSFTSTGSGNDLKPRSLIERRCTGPER